MKAKSEKQIHSIDYYAAFLTSSILDAKNSRRRFTLEEKLEIIDMQENQKISIAQITRNKNIKNEATVRTILRKKDEIKKQGICTGQYTAKSLTKVRSRVMLEMERLLFVWITEINVPIGLQEVQFKALDLFNWVKDSENPECLKDLTEKEVNETFVASNGWWHRFRYHSYIT